MMIADENMTCGSPPAWGMMRALGFPEMTKGMIWLHIAYRKGTAYEGFRIQGRKER